MFSPLPRMQATRLLMLFSGGGLLFLCSFLYSSTLSPSVYDLSAEASYDGYYGYYASSLSAAKSAASHIFQSSPRVTLFTWAGGNQDYELEPLEEYADLVSGAYPVGAKPWLPEVEGGAPLEWTIPEEERVKAVKVNQQGKDWDFPAPQVDLPMHVVQEYKPPTVEFALVIMGESAAVEAVTMIKGILMHISTPVHLHIVCDEDAMYHIDERVTLITRPSYDISVSYNLVTPEQIWARGARAGIGSTYHAGAGGLAKIFLHEILTETKRAIFIDIDTLFTVDPLLLWKEFAKFRPGQVFAVPTLGPDSDELTVCSCALLLDLEAMRERFQWVASDLRPGASRTDIAYSSLMAVGLDPRNPPFGDQGVYYAIWKARPELAGHLSLSWDVSHCRNHWGFSMADGDDEMTEEEQERRRDERMRSVEGRMRNAPEKFPIFPGILHFNCIDNEANSFTYSDIVDFPDWGPLVQTATMYKWTWLNRGDGSAKVERVMFEDVRFADERWPEVERVGGWTPAPPTPAALPVELPVYEGQGGGMKWDFAEGAQGQAEPAQPEPHSSFEDFNDYVLGEDGEWHQVGESNAEPTDTDWTEGEAEPPASDDESSYDIPLEYDESSSDEPLAYVDLLEDVEPTPPMESDWMDEPSVAVPYDDGAFTQPEPDFEPEQEDEEKPPVQEQGTWVLGPYHEWIWVDNPAVHVAQEAGELPAESEDSWEPPAAANVDAAIPAAVSAGHAAVATSKDMEREKLKEKLAAALAAHMKAPAAPRPAVHDSSPEPVEEEEELAPLRMAWPVTLEEAEAEPEFEDDVSMPTQEFDDQPGEEATAERGEWVESANGEWVWVAAE
ncbi:glycosyltransferase family 8 protein [Calocera viscosa TUFC12733]|uniref:Glycosyltransferase family 8 protein n=1 Tax=Calocera viscosa (strain TUFC12733) TaxID=1330018 RepID=A0A167NZL4_CALVF|nr:glycosyltransferase family 8 protein [Calocera viscosa TUFC12733]